MARLKHIASLLKRKNLPLFLNAGFVVAKLTNQIIKAMVFVDQGVILRYYSIIAMDAVVFFKILKNFLLLTKNHKVVNCEEWLF